MFVFLLVSEEGEAEEDGQIGKHEKRKGIIVNLLIESMLLILIEFREIILQCLLLIAKSCFPLILFFNLKLTITNIDYLFKGGFLQNKLKSAIVLKSYKG